MPRPLNEFEELKNIFASKLNENFENLQLDTGDVATSVSNLTTTVNNVSSAVTTLNTKVSQNTPVGTIIYYPKSTAPTGYLICNGGAIPAECTALKALIGNNTPNLIGRYVKGGTSIGTTTAAYTDNVSSVGNHTHTCPSGSYPSATGGAGGHNHTYTAGEPSIQELPCIKY